MYAVWSGRSSPTFRRNVLLPDSERKPGWLLTRLIPRFWRRGQYVTPKCRWSSIRPHDITVQKRILFIVTAAENVKSEIEPVSETNCFKKFGAMDEVKKKRLNQVKAALFLSVLSVTNPEIASIVRYLHVEHIPECRNGVRFRAVVCWVRWSGLQCSAVRKERGVSEKHHLFYLPPSPCWFVVLLTLKSEAICSRETLGFSLTARHYNLMAILWM
jgi:hypothetical protein